ncbi:hypothetical protein W02_16460 [Nitrospira sp. KM1]|nr:hypothetical protein W02_16460 [Nitrospira sp. KM1]
MHNLNNVLTDLRKDALELRKWMEDNPKGNIDVMDQVFIENTIQFLQITYATWKSRNGL